MILRIPSERQQLPLLCPIAVFKYVIGWEIVILRKARDGLNVINSYR